MVNRLYLAFLSAAFVLTGSAVSGPVRLVERWAWPVADGTAGSVAFFPADGHAASLVVGDAAGAIFRLSPAGELLFTYEMGGRSSCSPAVGDLDGDGVSEIISATLTGQVHCLDASGCLLWEAGLRDRVDYTVVISDVDADGAGEVLVTSRDGWVHCFDGNGRLLWRFYAEPQAGPVAAGDLTGDGRPEVVFGTDLGSVFCLGADGAFLWRTSLDGHFGRSLPVLADVAEKGRVNVLITRSEVCRNPAVLALDGLTGALLWEAATPMHGYGPLAVADVDGDGRREILVVDKSTSVTCLDASGRRKWTRAFAGRGCFYPPAVADLDGDGRLELLLGLRGEDSLHVLDGRGERVETVFLKGGVNCSPSVGDLDGDGVVEVYVLTQRPGRLVRLDVVGTKKSGKVLWSTWRGDSQRAGYLGPAGRTRWSPAKSRQQVTETHPLPVLGNALVGRNTFNVHVPGSPLASERTLQVALKEAGEAATRQVFFLGARDSTVRLPFYLLSPENAELELVLFEGTRTAPVAKWTAPVSLSRFSGDLAFLASQQAAADSLLRFLPEDALADRVTLYRWKGEVVGFQDYLRAAWAHFAKATRNWREQFAAEVEDERAHLTLLRKTLSFLVSLRSRGGRAPFVCWEDPNPWDERRPEDEYPRELPSCKVSLLALGNEVESRVVHVTNLTAKPLQVKVLPVQWEGDQNGSTALDSVLTIREVVAVGTAQGRLVRDALPKLAEGNVFRIPPLSTTDLWLTFRTHGLKSGTYRGVLELLGLGLGDFKRRITLELRVSRVRLPERSRLAFCTWPHLGANPSDPQAQRRFRDLLTHGETVFVLGPPAQRYDDRGHLVGQVDWSPHDAWAKQILGKGILLVPSFQHSLHGPKDAPLWSAAWEKAYRAALKRYVAHLRALGFDYSDFALYPVDEPWLTGEKSVKELLTCARLAKEADPRVQVYCNPAGAPTPENSAEAVPLVDIWCPQIDLLKQDKRLLAFYKSTDAEVWSYEAPGYAKLLKPLGLYRMEPWLAFRYGLSGCGSWTYNYGNLWFASPSGAFVGSYGLVYEDGRSLVPSRRWEAYRDGVEDSNLLTLLQSEILRQGRSAKWAAKLLRQAVDELTAGQERAQSINRLVIDYDPDYQQLLDYRSRLIRALEKLQRDGESPN